MKIHYLMPNFENSLWLIVIESEAEILMKFYFMCLFYVGLDGSQFRFRKLKL